MRKAYPIECCAECPKCDEINWGTQFQCGITGKFIPNPYKSGEPFPESCKLETI